MLRTLLLAAAVAIGAGAVSADEITLSKHRQGDWLHEGVVDMVVYYLDRDDHFEVVAIYVPKADPERRRFIRMGLKDGDSVRFGLPGFPHVLYSFAREGCAVRVTAEPLTAALTG